MKPNETFPKAKKKYIAVMILCFLFGGFAIISFLSHAYGVFWAQDVGFPPGRDFADSNRPPRFFSDSNNSAIIDSNASFPGSGRVLENPFARLFSPNEIFSLIGGIISIIAGIAN